MAEQFEASVEQCYRELISKTEEAHMLLDEGRIRAAFELAARAHSGQRRKDGAGEGTGRGNQGGARRPSAAGTQRKRPR